MGACLIEQFRSVEDFRTKDGQRHPLWLVLLLVIIGTMNGYVGYRGWGDESQTASSGINREIWDSKTWSTILLNNPTRSHGGRLQ